MDFEEASASGFSAGMRIAVGTAGASEKRCALRPEWGKRLPRSVCGRGFQEGGWKAEKERSGLMS